MFEVSLSDKARPEVISSSGLADAALATGTPGGRTGTPAETGLRLLLALTMAQTYQRRLEAALDDAALWLEAEADHPRPDPVPAMRLQASLARRALLTEDPA